MPRPFYSATAEQVLAVIDAVVAKDGTATAKFVAEFCDLLEGPAEKALGLAVDLGFLKTKADGFVVASPLCAFIRSPQARQKAAILRVMVDSYEPFVFFRQGIAATGAPERAAQQTKILLDIDAHREEIKNTLISLATYSGALVASSAGSYQVDATPIASAFDILSESCSDLAGAEAKVRQLLDGNNGDKVSREAILVPLANGLLFAAAGQAREAVVNAGNAIDSFLSEYAGRVVTSLAGATGINGKLDKLKAASKLPTKIVFKGKYLGHVRNGADHGADPEINAPWNISKATGEEYVLVACSFIGSVLNYEGQKFDL